MDFETWFKQHVPDAPTGKYHELLAAWDAATEAERERCAKLCDEIEAKAMADDKFSRSDIAFGKAAAAEACAEAIRVS